MNSTNTPSLKNTPCEGVWSTFFIRELSGIFFFLPAGILMVGFSYYQWGGDWGKATYFDVIVFAGCVGVLFYYVCWLCTQPLRGKIVHQERLSFSLPIQFQERLIVPDHSRIHVLLFPFSKKDSFGGVAGHIGLESTGGDLLGEEKFPQSSAKSSGPNFIEFKIASPPPGQGLLLKLELDWTRSTNFLRSTFIQIGTADTSNLEFGLIVRSKKR
jgi:hypothetical protein